MRSGFGSPLRSASDLADSEIDLDLNIELEILIF